VLLELLGRALLVTRNCGLGVFGERAATIRWNPLYIFGIKLPLDAFYQVVRLLRRVPGAGVLVVSLYVACILAPLMAISWWNRIVYSEGHINGTAVFVLIVIPLTLIVVLSVVLRTVNRLQRGR